MHMHAHGPSLFAAIELSEDNANAAIEFGAPLQTPHAHAQKLRVIHLL
jgi:hypothetical protein